MCPDVFDPGVFISSVILSHLWVIWGSRHKCCQHHRDKLCGLRRLPPHSPFFFSSMFQVPRCLLFHIWGMLESPTFRSQNNEEAADMSRRKVAGLTEDSTCPQELGLNDPLVWKACDLDLDQCLWESARSTGFNVTTPPPTPLNHTH